MLRSPDAHGVAVPPQLDPALLPEHGGHLANLAHLAHRHPGMAGYWCTLQNLVNRESNSTSVFTFVRWARQDINHQFLGDDLGQRLAGAGRRGHV